MSQQPQGGGSEASGTRGADDHRNATGRPRLLVPALVVAGGVALVAGLFLLTGQGGGASDIGAETPPVELVDFDGGSFSLEDLAGSPLVVNFWASWCPPCAAEMPEFERVHRALEDQVVFLGVNHSDSREAATALADSTGVTYRLAEDPQAELFRSFGAPGMPTTVFIDRAGIVREIVVGQITGERLMDHIRESLGVVHDA